ncbi:MAG TPA: response regulator [Verrucomicrobiales bacterium]|nr:response regulator [Verrucomicrobiales bacterium]
MEPLRVLVLENENLPGDQVNAVLRSAGLAPARFASSPEEIEQLVAEDRPDAVFLSLRPGYASREPLLAADLTFRHRIPVFYLETRFTEANLPLGYLVRSCESSGLAGALRSNGPVPTASGEDGILKRIASPAALLSAEGRFLSGNPAARSLFGAPEGESQPVLLWDLPGAAALSSALRSELPRAKQDGGVEIEVFDPDDRRWWRAQLEPAGDHVYLHLHDITARILSREQGNREEKLENLGILARGFAHDFNNVLTVLLGHLHMARIHQPLPAGCEADLDGARAAAARAQGMVQQLLTFARGGAPIRESHDLNRLVREWLERRPLTKSCPIECELAPVPLRVAVDPNQIRRLVENLVRNAEQALSSGGTIRLRARLLDRNSPPVSPLPRLDPERAYAYLEVRDEGKGIAESDLPRVFEPYFSTRPQENASGLGLTVCESIARAHHGAMAIDTREGSHTVVFLLLPLEAEHDAGSAPTPAPAAERPAPRVLVLEDDEQVRRFIGQILRLRPFEVVETADGEEAVQAFQSARAAGQPFDVLIFDLTIPQGLGGKDAIERIRRLDPNVRAIVSSGYYDDPVMSNHREYGFSAVLPKPYEPADLLRVVESVLIAKPAAPAAS